VVSCSHIRPKYDKTKKRGGWASEYEKRKGEESKHQPSKKGEERMSGQTSRAAKINHPNDHGKEEKASGPPLSGFNWGMNEWEKFKTGREGGTMWEIGNS